MSNTTLHLGPTRPLNPAAVLELLDFTAAEIEQEDALRRSYERARGGEEEQERWDADNECERFDEGPL
jgi:hypothetical protein